MAQKTSIGGQTKSQKPSIANSNKKGRESKNHGPSPDSVLKFRSAWQRQTKAHTSVKTLNKAKATPKIADTKVLNSPLTMIIREKEIISDPLLVTPSSIMRSSDIEAGVLIQAQASHSQKEEINKLLKRMTLSFSANKKESSFFIKEGLFAGAFFHLTNDDQNMRMIVNNGSLLSYKILNEHQNYLRLKLRTHEINLREIVLS